ncbi:MAG TPA: serine protease [Bacteroidia bacterium]|nr:serine protease [Bacteroidia bacterium]
MKPVNFSKFSFFIAVLAVVFASSCKSYNYSNFKPEPVTADKKLLPLLPVISKDELKKQLALIPGYYDLQNIVIDEVLKVHNDGLQVLYADTSEKKYGYYTFGITNQKYKVGGKGVYAASILTLGVPCLFGMPWWNFQTQMDVDFFIYDAKQNLVAKYKVFVPQNDTKVWIACYWGYSEPKSYIITNVKAHAKAIEKFSEIIQKDIPAINAKLIGGGTVKIEKSDVIGNAGTEQIILDPSREINKEKGSGTGFLVSENGYVVTNYHVIEDARDIYLYFSTDSSVNKCKASIVSEDKTNDIAVLKIDSGFVSPGKIPYTFSDNYNVSDEVFTIGYPQPDIMGSSYKYTKGEISSLSGIENNITMMQITTPLQPGNSGGPLFNKNGEVVGITTSTLNPFYIARYQGNIPQNVNYAVKSDYIKPLVKSYMDKSTSSIADLPLAEQIKVLGKFTCMIRVY